MSYEEWLYGTGSLCLGITINLPSTANTEHGEEGAIQVQGTAKRVKRES